MTTCWQALLSSLCANIYPAIQNNNERIFILITKSQNILNNTDLTLSILQSKRLISTLIEKSRQEKSNATIDSQSDISYYFNTKHWI